MSIKKYFLRFLPIVLLLVVSLALRLPLLNGSFWMDEAAQALESARPFSQQLSIRDDFQPPLLHYLIHFTLYLGKEEWWLRTVGALIPGLITIFFTYKIGQLLANKQVGIVSSLLLATSSFHIFYSQELRQYSLPAAFAAATWFMLIKAYKTNKSPSTPDLVIFALLQAAGLYSSYLYPFAMIGQGAWLLFTKQKHLRVWIFSFIGAVILFLPWLPGFLDQLSAGTTLQSTLPGWSSTVSSTQLKALPLVAAKFIFGVADVEINLLYIMSLVFIVIQLAALFFSNIMRKKSSTVDLSIIFWLVIPILSAWLISFWVPVLQPKRVLFCLPAFYLVLTQFAFSAIKDNKLFKVLPALPVLIYFILLLNIVGTIQYWRYPTLQRENWHKAIAEIEHDFPQRSIVIFSFLKPFAPWHWYADTSYPVLATGEYLLSDAGAEATVKRASTYDFVLVFDYLLDLTDPERKLDRTLVQYGYKEVDVLDYPVIGFIRIYSRPTAVISYK